MNSSTHLLLIDDDEPTNIFHSYVISSVFPDAVIHTFDSAQKALDWLGSDTTPVPEIAFLDINMPIMDGWQFLTLLANGSTYSVPRKVVVFQMAVLNNDQSQIANAVDCEIQYEQKPLTKKLVSSLLDIKINL